ncbi:MAG: hypothetical protein B6I19_06300, partial [Bacteroidetes bacterium 4572_114]
SLFIPFGPEAINNADDRKELLNRTLIWFDDIYTGLPENQIYPGFPNKLNIFPNPANGHINIKLPSEARGLVRINITDLSGKLLIEKSINASITDMYYWDNLNLQPGLYIVNLHIKNRWYSQFLKISEILLFPDT